MHIANKGLRGLPHTFFGSFFGQHFEGEEGQLPFVTVRCPEWTKSQTEVLEEGRPEEEGFESNTRREILENDAHCFISLFCWFLF